MIALVDCNNFYVSCERAFKPNLDNEPVIVLSNNDGCVISRSNEAKKLNIKMGAPFFQIKDFCSNHGVYVFSSNYPLYSSISKRVMRTLNDLAVRQEVYSIDESFLDLTGIKNLTEHGHFIRNRVKQWTGIPTSIGIGQTKVLAKFANYLSKKYPYFAGVCNLSDFNVARIDKAMQMTPVEELWGIGRKVAPKLKKLNIFTVYDLKKASHKEVGKKFNVLVERIILELNNIPCIEVEDLQESSKRIASTRSFATNISDKNTLLAALTYHIEKVSNKLTQQGIYAKEIVAFVNTNRFNDNYISESVNIAFPSAINSYRYMSKYLNAIVDKLYSPGVYYKKSGIIVSNLIDGAYRSRDLFNNSNIIEDELLSTLKNIKDKFGSTSISIATSKLSTAWHMKQDWLSQCYTTNINELLTV